MKDCRISYMLVYEYLIFLDNIQSMLNMPSTNPRVYCIP